MKPSEAGTPVATRDTGLAGAVADALKKFVRLAAGGEFSGPMLRFLRLKRTFRLVLVGVLLAGRLLNSPETWAQSDRPVVDSSAVRERDLLDVAEALFPRIHFKNHTDQALQGGRKVWVILPQLGYSPQTRLLAQLAANVAYRQNGASLSSVTGSLTYTQNRQIMLLAQATQWSAGNRWLWLGDYRLLRYPQPTYGLGIRTDRAGEIQMTYDYLRLYQTVYRCVAPHLYAGLGYSLDLRWGIRSFDESGLLTRISGYPFGTQGRSVSTGPRLGLVYDTRRNPINPQQGIFINALLRTDWRELGSDRTQRQFLLDARTYLPVSTHRRRDHVLAFWAYSVLTLQGNPPYLDLPSIGWDTNSGTGRGYVQGRYRGRNLVYVESEYRFSLRRDRLLGGVLFANAQSVSEPGTNRFERIAPAVGLGLRIRLNKYSRVNLAVDYGWGTDGSQGLYFNLGEVF